MLSWFVKAIDIRIRQLYHRCHDCGRPIYLLLSSLTVIFAFSGCSSSHQEPSQRNCNRLPVPLLMLVKVLV